MWQALLNLLLWLALVAGTQTPMAQPPVATPAPDRETPPAATHPLDDALTFAPANASILSFTDWTTIKGYAGVEALTGQSPEDAKIDLLMTTNKTQAAGSGFALSYFHTQFAQWGWDTLDLDWEATISGEHLPPVYVLRVRDDFDFAALEQLLADRDFADSEYDGAILYTHPLDLSVDWRTELAVFNAALLPDEHILIHASSPEPIMAVLDAHTGAQPAWAEMPAYTEVAAQLGEVAAAHIAAGSALCARLNMTGIVEALAKGQSPGADDLARLRSDLFGDQPLHPYLAFGVGYRYEKGKPVGIVVLSYPATTQAQADLAARRQLAEQGTSVVTKQPYSETLFTLTDAVVADTSIVLTVSPTGELPRRLFDMFMRQDMVFAACP